MSKNYAPLLFGASSVMFTLKMFMFDGGGELPTPSLPNSDTSLIGILVSVTAAFITGLMRVTNSLTKTTGHIEDMKKTNGSILESNNKMEGSLNKILESNDKSLESNNKIQESLGKLLEAQENQNAILNQILELELKKKDASDSIIGKILSGRK